MKIPTIATIIVKAGPEKFGEDNFQAAKAWLEAGGATATETEGPPQFVPAPYDPDEELDFSLLVD